MALPPPAAAAVTNIAMNPIETFFSGLNTNTYFIGLMMLLLNLGGRHLATSLTVEQDKFLQNQWFRRILLFVVIFVATRNVFTAFWLSISIIVVLAYLTNESSRLYIFGAHKPPVPEPIPEGLNPEETDIFRKLNEKMKRHQEYTKEKPVAPQPTYQELFTNSYISAMSDVKMAV
uniref:Uncharacterized protein n=1 Tax=viral metagenome TaxID=1070528 RepID=A0A6C0K3I6_9ZZZZ